MDVCYFYVSAICGPRRYMVAGPYATHEAALAQVGAVRKLADESDDPRGAFMAWGTAGGNRPVRTQLGPEWAPGA